MNNQSLSDDADREVLEHYARLSRFDTSEPSTGTDGAVIAFAQRQAVARTPSARRASRWLPAAALLASVVVLGAAGRLLMRAQQGDAPVVAGVTRQSQLPEPSGNAQTVEPAAAPAALPESRRGSAPVLSSAKTDGGRVVKSNAAAGGSRWIAGQHYRVLSAPGASGAAGGKIQVIEFFWYGCTHCYELERSLQGWARNLSADVEFVRMPVGWSPIHAAQARLYYALESLNALDSLHASVYDEVNLNERPLAAIDPDEALRLQQRFAVAHGIAADAYAAAYNSPPVQDKARAAQALATSYRVEGVPTIVVGGRYLTDVGMAGGQSSLISLINDLVTGLRSGNGYNVTGVSADRSALRLLPPAFTYRARELSQLAYQVAQKTYPEAFSGRTDHRYLMGVLVNSDLTVRRTTIQEFSSKDDFSGIDNAPPPSTLRVFGEEGRNMADFEHVVNMNGAVTGEPTFVVGAMLRASGADAAAATTAFDAATAQAIVQRYFSEGQSASPQPDDPVRWVLLDSGGQVLRTGLAAASEAARLRSYLEGIFPGIKTSASSRWNGSDAKGRPIAANFVWLAAGSPAQ